MLLRRILCKYQHLARGFSSGETSISSFLATKTVQRQNGGKEKRLFTDQEYQRRLASLRFYIFFCFSSSLQLFKFSGKQWQRRISLPVSSPLCTTQPTSLTLSTALLGVHTVWWWPWMMSRVVYQRSLMVDSHGGGRLLSGVYFS